jgi:hypothetical protein
MQSVFGGTTSMAANNLYQSNQQTFIPTNQIQIPKPPDYTEILSAASLESDPSPLFTSEVTARSGAAATQLKPYVASEINQDTLLPPSFLIDWHNVSPLVTVPELKQYLRLLASFDVYLRHVISSNEDVAIPIDDSKFLPVFEKCVPMFDTWATETLARNAGRAWTLRDPSDLPSIEILMVWHAYLTNPRWYFEDSARLGKLGPLPLALVVSLHRFTFHLS